MLDDGEFTDGFMESAMCLPAGELVMVRGGQGEMFVFNFLISLCLLTISLSPFLLPN